MNKNYKRLLYSIALCLYFAPMAYATSDFRTGTLEEDSLQLVNFYYALNGPNWEMDDAWDLSQPVSTWNGIALSDDNSMVESIMIGNNQEMTGVLPDINLPGLKILQITNSNLTGAIPDFSNLPLLERLNLGFSDFSGGIPDFTNLPTLERLYLDYCNLSGEIPNFSNLPQLLDLNLGNNNLTGGIPNFSNLPLLEALVLINNNLSGEVPDFSNLPLLEGLDLGSNNLSGEIPNFSNLPLLYLLDIDYNNLSGEIPDFSNLPQLIFLYLSSNSLSGEIPDFSNLPLLVYILVNDNNLSGRIPDFSNLAMLDNLEFFYFDDNQLEGCYPLWLCDLNIVSSNSNPGLPDGGSSAAFSNFCNNPSSQFGVPCDDLDSSTVGEVIQPDCSCAPLNSFSNFVDGTVFNDTQENCILDTDELTLENWLIIAEGATASYYSVSDASGHYRIYTDIGDYTIRVEEPNAYWGVCPTVEDYPVSFPNPDDSFLLDIPLESLFLCPLLNVDISTPLVRRCFDTDYYVYYCNEGTATAEDAYIEITFDDFLIVNSSTLPWTSQDGQTYAFELDDEIPIGACGSFQVNVTVDCESVLGQTHCVEAHIYPDSICLPDNTLWDGSTIKLEASCEEDSIQFLIENIGENDMTQPLEYIIIVDDLILRSGSFMLPSGGADSTSEASTGATFRMLAEQAEYHPTNSAPSISVEGCTDGSGPISLGFVNIFSEDDADPFISMDCQVNIGAYDPNDKTGYPVGLGINHLIDTTTTLEYRIRFQNTGTDTAFLVVLRDTLSEFIDPATIRMGTSSHPYEWEILGNNTLQVVYDNIMLPDSNVNEAASHGFVKFKIDQKPNNPAGTLITNRAGIYFDFNEPVMTNTTSHMIEDKLVIYDTLHSVFCYHWFYGQDTVFETHAVFEQYELFLTNIIDIIGNPPTIIDLEFEGSGIYEGISYENDTTLTFAYPSTDECDSIVLVNIDILSSLKNPEANQQLELFPNPTTGELFLKLDFSTPQDLEIIKIYNQIGQVMYSLPVERTMERGQHVIPLNVNGFEQGIYYFSVVGEQLIWTRKLTVY